MKSTKAKPGTEKLLEEEREMGAEIERLEAELAQLESPAPALNWEAIQAGGLDQLDKREMRRITLPKLIRAARVRQLELRRERHEAEIGPLSERLRRAEAKLEEARAERLEAAEREGAAHVERSDAHTALRYARQGLRQTERDLRALGVEG